MLGFGSRPRSLKIHRPLLKRHDEVRVKWHGLKAIASGYSSDFAANVTLLRILVDAGDYFYLVRF